MVGLDYCVDDVVDFGGVEFGVDGEGDFAGVGVVGYGIVLNVITAVAEDGEDGQGLEMDVDGNTGLGNVFNHRIALGFGNALDAEGEQVRAGLLFRYILRRQLGPGVRLKPGYVCLKYSLPFGQDFRGVLPELR